MIFTSGAEVDCGPQFTSVLISLAQYPWFNPRHMRMHLNDPFCKSSVSNTHVSFKFPLGACGSRHIISANKVIFFNRVFIVNKPHHKFQKRIMEIPFICKYRVMNSPGYKIKGFLWLGHFIQHCTHLPAQTFLGGVGLLYDPLVTLLLLCYHDY